MKRALRSIFKLQQPQQKTQKRYQCEEQPQQKTQKRDQVPHPNEWWRQQEEAHKSEARKTYLREAASSSREVPRGTPL